MHCTSRIRTPPFFLQALQRPHCPTFHLKKFNFTEGSSNKHYSSYRTVSYIFPQLTQFCKDLRYTVSVRVPQVFPTFRKNYRLLDRQIPRNRRESLPEYLRRIFSSTVCIPLKYLVKVSFFFGSNYILISHLYFGSKVGTSEGSVQLHATVFSL